MSDGLTYFFFWFLQRANSMLLFHAELDQPVPDPSSSTSTDSCRHHNSFLHSRPESFETKAIDLIATLQEQHPKLPMHIVHLSAASALPTLRRVRGQGLPLSVETCFHYCTPFSISLTRSCY